MDSNFEKAVHDRRRLLGNPYAFVDDLEEIQERRAALRVLENPYAFIQEGQQLVPPALGLESKASSSPTRRGKPQVRSAAEIEKIAGDVHMRLWEQRAEIFPDSQTRRSIDLLDPTIALRLYGYDVEIVGALGRIADSGRPASNVAGLIDKRSRKVLLSSGLSPAVRKFTAAHELGHALMHEFAGMHRDKPMDGSSSPGDWLEREADQFAAFFLMPRKLLTRIFEQTFGAIPFVMDDVRRFALAGSIPSAHWTPRILRELSMLLSSATRFNGKNIASLTMQFGVSSKAMAIRLEQLQLVALG
ncbi:MAG: ImmA/IrrE family metallo-endopeptidase [Gammaproteobacteria bacterium]|nr:ImmA/IrrE family metallo-endopeptidase [Gammaproteobacteria bacterium]MBU1441647.1 ImmA/IrrE family metallo-endopeptidase [Gammaproteobacteria bacterium]MBU2286381.1 ImmA/IrrE family metallo-endopeptidase [Gammaproteobacteria bacterium]